MYISSLTLTNFRNYRKEKIEFSPNTNVIYGDNAQGKTNILEAVYIFSQGRSHRTKTDGELIRFGEDFAKLGLEFHDAERDYKAVLQIIKNGKKNIRINGVQITRLSMLMNYLNAVMFSPEDLTLVKGSPSSDARKGFAVGKAAVHRRGDKPALPALPHEPYRLPQGSHAEKQPA